MIFASLLKNTWLFFLSCYIFKSWLWIWFQFLLLSFYLIFWPWPFLTSEFTPKFPLLAFFWLLIVTCLFLTSFHTSYCFLLESYLHVTNNTLYLTKISNKTSSYLILYHTQLFWLDFLNIIIKSFSLACFNSASFFSRYFL